MEGAGSMQDSQLILLATHLYPSKVNGCHPSGPQRPCHKFQLKSDYSPLAQPFLVGGRCAEGLWEGLVDVVLLCSMTQRRFLFMWKGAGFNKRKYKQLNGQSPSPTRVHKPARINTNQPCVPASVQFMSYEWTPKLYAEMSLFAHVSLTYRNRI